MVSGLHEGARESRYLALDVSLCRLVMSYQKALLYTYGWPLLEYLKFCVASSSRYHLRYLYGGVLQASLTQRGERTESSNDAPSRPPLTATYANLSPQIILLLRRRF